MNLQAEPVTEALVEWLNDSESSIRSLRSSLDADRFCENYLGVIAAGRSDAASIADRLVRLVDDTFTQRVSLSTFLDDYIDAMSVTYKQSRVFLPSFTDSCLSDLHPQSPFRGLNYCWLVGEAYYALRRGHTQEAHDILQKLAGHIRSMPRRSTTTPQRAGRDVDADIVQIKEMLHGVITTRKWKWTDSFPYPCRTSTHFYLSGIRFYWGPIVERERTARRRSIGDSDRFSVQSTTSGLFSTSERYGYLLPATATAKRRAAVAEQLLGEVPIGSLALDLMDGAPTIADRKAVKYFDRWSDLVARATLPIVEETLADCDQVLTAPKKDRDRLCEQAQQALEARASKNPMRTFYFDCGLIASARRSLIGPTATPHVQYITTQASDPHNDPSGLGVEMFRRVRSHCGDGLRVYAQRGDHFAHPDLPVWTLVPVGAGLGDARTIWSNRSSHTAPILHGFEGRSTRLLRETIGKWGYDIRHHAGADALMVGLSSGTYARGDLPKEAMTAGTAFLFLCAAQSVGGPVRRMRSVQSELRGVPTSSAYSPVLTARDWTRLS